MKHLYLVDVSSMYFRSYYAIRDLKTSQGLPTNALYGFLKMTIKLLTEVKPEFLAYCFDRKEPSFRKELYEPYKANRAEMPEDLQKQVFYIPKITQALGINTFDKENFEADDVIGTLCQWGQSQGFKITIVSSDKDFVQLLNPQVTLWDTFKDIKYDPQKAFKKWGVKPYQMVDYLALCGDASDNIPGVRGIGPKGATILLSEYESLKDIYQNIDKIKNKKQKENLLSCRKEAFLSQELVTIRKNIPFDLKAEDFCIQKTNTKDLEKLLKELEFKTFQKILLPSSISDSKANSPSEQVSNQKIESLTLEKAQKLLKKQDMVWGFMADENTLLGIDSHLFLLHPESKELILYLESLDLQWKGFDLKAFWRKLKFQKAQKAYWSSQLAAYVIFSEKITSWKMLYEKLKDDMTLSESSDELTSSFSYQKIYEVQLAFEILLKERLKEADPSDIYGTIELPLLPILFDMEKHGVLIDTDKLTLQSQELKTKIDEIETRIHAQAGIDFNIASPKQLAEVLFDQMGLPIIKKTKTGPSTESSVLETLAPLYPIAQDVIQIRELLKLKSTYVDALPQLIDPQTHRVHTHFNQATVTTGRLSSSSPNLQNIPIKNRTIRQAFICPKDMCLVSADYSQIELRILAHLSGDPGLVAAFKKDIDVHLATAREIFPDHFASGGSLEEKRSIAKAVNFGLAYGQTAFGLSKVLKITQMEAKEIITRYFERFPSVKGYMQEIIQFAQKHGYVETLFGRRRIIYELHAKKALRQKFGERAAINAPLQGSASDIVKKAMICLFCELNSPMILQVHDELVFEVACNKLESEMALIKDIMENIITLNIPLKVNIQSGSNWDEAH